MIDLLQTALLPILDVEVPIVQAPIGSAVTPDLVAAVSNTGGLGVIPGSWMSIENLRAFIQMVRSKTARPFAVNLCLEWEQERRLGCAIDEGIQAVSFFWGDPEPNLVATCKNADVKVLHTVGSATEALQAQDAGIDVVVAQSWEAGGHVRSAVGAMALIPAIADVVDIPVIAAGGISDGRGLAAAIMLGASGIWMGTRFLLSDESDTHADYQQALLAACESDTTMSQVFEVGWPNADHRTLTNSTVRQSQNIPLASRPDRDEIIGNKSNGSAIKLYSDDTPTKGDFADVERMALYAGQSVGGIHKIQPAAEIVEQVTAEARQLLARSSSA